MKPEAPSWVDVDGEEFEIHSMAPSNSELQAIRVRGHYCPATVYMDKEQARRLIDYLTRWVEE